MKNEMTFYQRWHLTLCLIAGYFAVGLPLQLAVGGPTLWWTLLGIVLVGAMAMIEYKKLAPARLRYLEQRAWLLNLPRTPNGGAFVDKAGWERHFGKNGK